MRKTRIFNILAISILAMSLVGCRDTSSSSSSSSSSTNTSSNISNSSSSSSSSSSNSSSSITSSSSSSSNSSNSSSSSSSSSSSTSSNSSSTSSSSSNSSSSSSSSSNSSSSSVHIHSFSTLHRSDVYHWYSCQCGYETTLESHDYLDTTEKDVPATEESTGKDYMICKTCGYETYEIIDKLPHTHKYGDWTVDKEATLFETGTKHKECICGDIVTETIDLVSFPRVYINYQDFYPNAPDATNYSAWANWCWDYLTVPISYQSEDLSFDCYAQMRIQGATSTAASYLKKNYTIKLYNDRECTDKNKVTLVEDWGKESKYVLKANWIDYTSARNLVTADIWKDVVGSRSTSEVVSEREYLDVMINNGAVDGYPVMLYFNNEYYGLYTMNIPKDNWLFGMKKDEKQALLFADGTQKKENGSLWQSTGFKEKIEWDSTSLTGSGWEAEYAYDETNTQWMADSMNEAIDVVQRYYHNIRGSLDGKTKAEKQALKEGFRAEIKDHLDIDGCIDYLIFLHCIQGFPDNSTKNVIWSTYDGVKWSPNAYDLDTTWGMAWDGEMYVFEQKPLNYATGGLWKTNQEDWYHANLRGNALFEAIMLYYSDELLARYAELRADGAPLSYEVIENKFTTFINSIPEELYEREATDYPSRPSEQISSITGQKNTTNLEQILTYAEQLLSHMDTQYTDEVLGYNSRYFE